MRRCLLSGLARSALAFSPTPPCTRRGGSTTGLGKAIAVRTGADQVVIPTAYAGSEMTDILGETVGGEKTT